MKNSLIIVGFFVLGILAGMNALVPVAVLKNDPSTYALYILMLLVGMGIGADKKAWEVLKKARLKIILVPLTVVIGTLLGAAS
jgi:uncharacterized membrane protein YbjE (DUF340 family)